MANPNREPAQRLDGPAFRLVQALREFTNEMEAYIAGSGRDADLHRTDLSALAVVMDRGREGESTTPGQLSSALHLSPSATSAMLDRLERVGHVTRTPHATDRRSVVVELSDDARAVGAAMFGPLSAEVGRVLAQHEDDELERLGALMQELVLAVRRARS